MSREPAKDLLPKCGDDNGSDSALLTAIEQGARMGYWWCDLASGQIHCSAGLNRLLGREPEATLCDGPDDLLEGLCAEDTTSLEQTVKSVIAGTTTAFDLVCRLSHTTNSQPLTKNSSPRYLRHRGPTPCSLGGADALVVTVQDVTEETRENEQDYWLDTLVEVVPGLICVKDGQGRWLAAKDDELEAADLGNIGYRGKTDRELAEFSETYRAVVEECIETDEAAFQEGVASHSEESFPKQAGGAARVLETTKVPLFHEDGSRKGLVVVSHDITERRRAESMNRRLGRILEDSNNEIFVIDERTHRFIQVNRGARLNLGYSAEELRQMAPFDISEDVCTVEQFERRVAPLLDGSQRLLTFDSIHRRKDGSTYPVEIRLLLSRNEPEPVFVAIVEDITERKQNERLRDEFISIVSHELRTPLTPISGVLELLSTAPEIVGDDRIRQMVDVAYRNAGRLRRLIDQLLDFRNLSLGHASFDMRDVELRDVVSQTAKNASFLDERYDFELQIDTDAQAHHVWVDRRYLIQLINILLSNAAKFSPADSTISLSIGQVGEFARLSIADEGPGIPEKMREHIFDRFVQADSTSTRHHGGTGLGLSMAQLIVKSFEGKISFECGEKGGTTFHVDLPLREHLFADSL
jgi:PAS domain S-box-containing protein